MTETPFEKVRADLKRYALREDRTSASLGFTLRMLLLTPGFQFVFSRRLQEMAVKIPLVGRLLRRILWWWSCVFFGSELAMAARIGGGLYVPHPFGIVVGAATLGRNVSILQNVTIGRKAADDPRDPVIEDDVSISAGAVVVGAIIIGQGATIGANAVVTRDVPAQTIAMGIPAKVVVPKSPEDTPVTDASATASPVA
ncbi:serine O-acetyltransferase EpsC [Neorhizobium sp. NPDC001467]|uniref:serine O-acetyltransferase EpsC n=1 Tax=Neorhizobium sp. NPDC001467 TaxID=3390595 RepID=UPI003D063EFA